MDGGRGRDRRGGTDGLAESFERRRSACGRVATSTTSYEQFRAGRWAHQQGKRTGQAWPVESYPSDPIPDGTMPIPHKRIIPSSTASTKLISKSSMQPELHDNDEQPI